MHRELIISAFAKAKKEALEETGLESSINKASERIAIYIVEVGETPFSSKSLRNLYSNALDPEKTVEILQSKVVDTLCKYIGYDNYRTYVDASKDPEITVDLSIKKEKPRLSPKAYLWFSLVILGVIIALSVYFFSNRQRWMQWEETHYVEIAFDAQKLQDGSLKIYKQERIDHFKKVRLRCDSVFFYGDGRPRFWYGKNQDRALEFFTDSGRHPETGKILKPLSKYMIDKYVCVQN